MTRHIALALGATTALAACEPSTLFQVDPVTMDPPIASSAIVESDGSIAITLEDTLIGHEIDASGNGYGFAVGHLPDTPGSAGYAGLTAATDLGVQGATGFATLTGGYQVARFDELDLNSDDRPDTSVFGIDANVITLTADFDNNTLTGTHDQLTVNGSMTGGTLSGTVTYEGLDGTLLGQVGETRAIGAFYGTDAVDTVFAGGFDVEE